MDDRSGREQIPGVSARPEAELQPLAHAAKARRHGDVERITDEERRVALVIARDVIGRLVTYHLTESASATESPPSENRQQQLQRPIRACDASTLHSHLKVRGVQPIGDPVRTSSTIEPASDS